VIGDDCRDARPGSGRIGVIAIPDGAKGHHKDPAKTAAAIRSTTSLLAAH
jgi:hypothetical protein